ncbi:hypothetical protein KKI24_25830 [bacterium]|nr:hypothetical protein [bacterium]
MTDQIPDRWWLHHKDQILTTARDRAALIFAGIAQKLGWPTLIGEEDVAKMMVKLEPRFNMSADELIDAAIDTALTEAIFEVFSKEYGHLCSRSESGEILIPVRCIPELHRLSEEEIESRIENLLKDYPGTVFCIPDPKTETIN